MLCIFLFQKFQDSHWDVRLFYKDIGDGVVYYIRLSMSSTKEKQAFSKPYRFLVGHVVTKYVKTLSLFSKSILSRRIPVFASKQQQ